MSQSNILQQQESTETSPRCAKGNWCPARLEWDVESWKVPKFQEFTHGRVFFHGSIREAKKNQVKTGCVKWRDVPRRVDAVQTASQSVSWSRTAGDTLLRTTSSMWKTHHRSRWFSQGRKPWGFHIFCYVYPVVTPRKCGASLKCQWVNVFLNLCDYRWMALFWVPESCTGYIDLDR